MSSHSRDYDSKILEFLKTCLNSSNFEVFPLAGDASARRYARIVFKNESYVLMIWDPFIDDGNYPFTSVLNHFKKHKVQVPDIKASSPEKGLILLEDLGDLTLERKFWESQKQSLVLPFYFQAIDELIKIHYPSSEDKSNCTAFKVAFDHAKLLWEMNYGREHLIEKLCKKSLSPTEKQALDYSFSKICALLDSEPKRICHRDYHSRNLMIKLGQMRVIDFQDARMGPIQYDLVSLLHDSYVQLSEESISAILKYYKLQASNYCINDLDTESFDYIFNIQMIQRCFKACGSFASFYNMRSDTRYLKYISSTINKVHTCIANLNEFVEFKNMIQDFGLLDHDYNNRDYSK